MAEEIKEAIENAKRSLRARVEYDEKHQPQGFSKWGNDKSISRTMDAIDEMENGTASERRIRYWKQH